MSCHFDGEPFIEKCPICGAEAVVTEYYMDDPPVGVCERYLDCSKCGYIERMAYSDIYSGFEKGRNFWFARIKNIRKVINEIKYKNYRKDLWRW